MGYPHLGCDEELALSRRRLLLGTTSLALWGLLPKAAIAGTRDPRLLVIVLRGAVDGLALAAPVGDPAYTGLRGKLAIPRDGTGAGLPLDTMFALNGAMPFLHGLYKKREALVLHAVASPYRGRSHFDGQDVLESGLGGVSPSQSGWLNRALAGLPNVGAATGATPAQQGLSMGAVVPLVMRGTAPVLSWTPKANQLPLRDQTVERLMDLYAHTDSKLAKAFAEGLEIDRIGQVAASPTATKAAAQADQPPRPFRAFIDTAQVAAKFLTTPGGPRVGALSFDGWDTHANEGVISGQLATKFAGLDAAIAAFAQGMGAAWSDTAVLIITEFGRTARTNGTEGTDHGTGSVALLLGGAVKGGRVIADWPGLSDAALYEGRDLKPTLDVRAVMKGVLRDHLGIPDGALASSIFPDSASLKGLQGLMA
jgi:uncharacterized protein (DUF1501 family)